MAEKACMDCKFFTSNNDQDAASLGECHRYPPRTASIHVGYGSKKEPVFHRVVTPNLVSPVGWCGEFILRIKNGLPAKS